MTSYFHTIRTFDILRPLMHAMKSVSCFPLYLDLLHLENNFLGLL